MPRVLQQYGNSIVYLELGGQWYCFDLSSPPLGSGAMGVVFLGYTYPAGTPVAVKMVRNEYANVYQIRERARSEASMSFLHPNIIRIYGVCEYADNSGPMYILSEYVQGVTFDRYCKESLSYCDNSERLVSIMKNSAIILDALQYIHDVGVIHRDIKPSNIMVSSKGVPKIMDLGIAKFERTRIGESNGFIGTSLYAAPELINGEIVDSRIDVYAMGVTIYEMICGYNPFCAESQNAILSNQLKIELPENEILPRPLYKILLKSTAKNRNDRYMSASQFSDDLKEFLNLYVSNPNSFSSRRVRGIKNWWSH